MKYIKLFESNKEWQTPWEIEKTAKLISSYLDEYDDENDIYHDIVDTIIELCPIETEYSDYINYKELLVTLEYIETIKNKKSKTANDDYKNRLIKQLSLLIKEIEKLELEVKKEDIEDLFLDIKNCTIRRNKSGFTVVITDVEKQNVKSSLNNIWEVVGKRLPENVEINHLEASKEDEDYKITVYIK